MKSWLVKYFVSYLIIGALPLLLGFIVYYTNITTVKGEVERNNFAVMTQAVSELDYLVGEMKNIAYHFSGYLADFTGPLRGGYPYGELSKPDQDRIAQRIKSYQDSLEIPVTILVYFRGGTRLYTADGAIPYSDFESSVKHEGELARSGFFSSINRVVSDASFRLTKGAGAENLRVEGGMEGGSVVYLYPVPYLDILPQATVCFMLKDQAILSIMENYLGALRGNLYLYNGFYQNIFSYGSPELPGDVIKNLGGLKGIGVYGMKINGRSDVVMRYISENTSLSCIYIVRKPVFFSRVAPMQYILLGLVTLFALAGFLSALFFSRRNYRPVRRLLVNIGGTEWEHEYPGGSEFDFILNKWNAVEEKNLILNHELDVQRPMVAYSCLHKLLKGEYTTKEELDYYLKCSNINFIGPYFFVLIIAPSGIYHESKTLSRQIQIILSSLENTVLPMGNLYSVELILEQQVAVIGNSMEMRFKDEPVSKSVASHIANYIMERYAFGIKTGIGRIQDSPFKINASFLEAMVVMSSFITGTKHIVAFEEVMERESEQYEYPVIEQAMYIQSVKQGNKDMALKAVDNMMANIGQVDSFPIIQCLCFDIINMLIRISGHLGSPLTRTDILIVTGFTDLEFFGAKVKELTAGLCDKYLEMQEQKDSLIKSKIINYINGNFCNNQFSLQQVADLFDISSNYLSRFLKQETGRSFSEYVSMLRIDKVKELLVVTDLQIKEVVSRVGYMDTASFLRKFRAAEGITPGQFRERMRK
ncbi:MAG: AraC family transcriptional regulator [Treponema sp.]|jgi:AraC-like DNA-binding protein|nr:AraC family transcriptional regulator [Treponema sp.]